jgi:hypothetical protein
MTEIPRKLRMERGVYSLSFFKWDDLPTVEIMPQVKRKIVHLEKVMLVYIEVGAGVEVPIHQHPNE